MEDLKQPFDYKETLESLPICIKVLNVDGGIVFINEGGKKEHFLETEEDLKRFDYKKTIKEEYLPAIEEAFKGAFKGENISLQYEHIPGSSKFEWCAGSMSPLKDKYGKIISVLFCSLDISALKKSEQGSKTKELMFLSLLDSVPLCIKWFDKNGILMSVNKGAIEEHHLEKLTSEEIKNWDYWGCIDSRYHDAVKQGMAKALSGETSSFEMRHVPGTSRGLWCFSSMVPIKNEKGGVEMVLFISNDFTEVKKKEDEIIAAGKDLKKLNDLMINRELKMIELKKEIEGLNEKIREMGAK